MWGILVQIGAMMAGMSSHSRALEDIEALREHPLEQLARVTGESQEALIAELQSGLMDYREFYWYKMSQHRGGLKGAS